MQIKKKALWAAAGAAIVIGAIIFLSGSYIRKDLQYRDALEYAAKAEAAYVELKDYTTSRDTELLAQIGGLIEGQAAKEGEVAALEREVVRLQLLEPKQPELESEPLVINLRAQIGALETSVLKHRDIINIQDAVILRWNERYFNEKELRLNLETALSEEQRAYAMARNRIKSLEWDVRKYKIQAGFGKVGTVLGLVAGGYIIYNGATK